MELLVMGRHGGHKQNVPHLLALASNQCIMHTACAPHCRVVRNARALVVLLVDLLDASGSMLGRVRELVGNNPIVLVGEWP